MVRTMSIMALDIDEVLSDPNPQGHCKRIQSLRQEEHKIQEVVLCLILPNHTHGPKTETKAISYMTHLTPFRVLPRRSIRIRKCKSKTWCTLHIRTINLHGRLMFRLRLLEFIAVGYGLLFLAVEGSYEAFWLEVVNDLTDNICFLQAGRA